MVGATKYQSDCISNNRPADFCVGAPLVNTAQFPPGDQIGNTRHRPGAALCKFVRFADARFAAPSLSAFTSCAQLAELWFENFS
jgi:hypothetical protein